MLKKKKKKLIKEIVRKFEPYHRYFSYLLKLFISNTIISRKKFILKLNNI